MPTVKIYFQELSNQAVISQLQQLTCLTWDGDLIDKATRSQLVKSGLCERFGQGWNIITPKGVQYLLDLGFINF